ncbi:MAG: single-stranded-DNA-specific exonuclease RecJ [Planctomycetota bacterium]|nr:single-stranded-DNA-specific exonuclease RecJ [Planctomycetota bacterium]
MVSCRWSLPPQGRDSCLDLAGRLGVSELTARVLVARGLSDAGEARRFLNPSLNDLLDPSLLADMEKAAGLIRTAIRAGRKIMLYGDYDVDGAASAAILVRFFTLLPYPVEVYLPERFREGYGLTRVAVAHILERRPDLLIAVDNGIGAREEIAELKRHGISVIVVDHHHADGGAVPDADAIINPKRPGDPYPDKDLCAATLAFKLAWALARGFSNSKKVGAAFREFLCGAVGMACLGTVADVAPLRGENRVVVSHGLKALGAAPCCGIEALMRVGRLDGRRPTARDVAFVLAPRLNAAGRMESPSDALELLLCDRPERARELALKLERLNRMRQKVEAEILEAARQTVLDEASVRGSLPPALVVGGEGWHRGVIGIVAARLCEEFDRPAVVVAFSDGVGHGSARSPEGFHLARMLAECAGDLLRSGGHSLAAGLTLRRDRFEAFRRNFEEAAIRRGAGSPGRARELPIDAIASLAELDRKAVDEMDSMAPFGEGNPKPVLAAMGLQVRSQLRFLRDGKSFSFYAMDEACRAARQAVAFRMADRADELAKAAASGPLDLAFQLSASNVTGEVELHLVDFRPSASAAGTVTA